jgi:hypothetical protein
MKKIFTKHKFKKFNTTRSKKNLNKRNKKYNIKYTSYKDSINNIKDKLDSPSNLVFLSNTIECNTFFKKLRGPKFISNYKGNKFINMALNNVSEIDYSAVCVLNAIIDDLRYKNIIVKTNLPNNKKSKKFLEDTGFLNTWYDNNGNKLNFKCKSELIFFERGSGLLTVKDNKKISDMVMNAMYHITGNKQHCLPIKTLILEICGNSIEWGNTSKKQWLFGIKYEKNKAVFTVTDVGIGILKTLKRKFNQLFEDRLINKTSLDILIGAFAKKYNSNTLEENRNKGLPSVRLNYEMGNIKNLVVITNDVFLSFSNPSMSTVFANKNNHFDGTFYQWEMDIDTINKIYLNQ